MPGSQRPRLPGLPRRVAATMGAAALLASCGGSGAAGIPSQPASQPASASPSTAAPSAGSAGAPIKVGVLTALTGSNGALGKDFQDATNLYLDSVHGEMAGRPVQVIFPDTAFKPDVSLTKAHQLAESDKVQVVMGMGSTA